MAGRALADSVKRDGTAHVARARRRQTDIGVAANAIQRRLATPAVKESSVLELAGDLRGQERIDLRAGQTQLGEHLGGVLAHAGEHQPRAPARLR
jgi:hypothetical protein